MLNRASPCCPPATTPSLKTKTKPSILSSFSSDRSISIKTWVCSICGHIHQSAEPPRFCEVCKAGGSNFVSSSVQGRQYE
ncbi:rubredoxin-like domain-containing protein [Pontiella agarivorans]|uniref:rubredoxin-like domain-containing protein n=1 Tax=Pontiella agarivorans TaxID=3038953 RepID=UPI003D671EC0